MSDTLLPLITKYRPSDWDEFIGNEEIIGSLIRRLQEPARPHAFLFTGPSGTGKTTAARIVAKELGCEVMEIDAASNNGIEAMRDLVNLGQYRSLSGAGKRMFILDEAHGLSRPAFNSILKLIEEPPEFLYLSLCTTELAKIIPTVVQRCFHVALRPVKTADLAALLEAISAAEEWDVASDVMSAVIVAANGSPRRAITILQSVHDCADRDEVKRIIRLHDDDEPLMQLIRNVVSTNRNWPETQRLLKLVFEEDMDEAAVLAGRYMMKVLLDTKSEKDAQRVWQMMEALVFPADTYDRKLAFVAAVGRIYWGGG